MTNAARARQANIFAWTAIGVALLLFFGHSRGWFSERSSEKLTAQAVVTAPQALMTSMVNGMHAPAFADAFRQQLSAMESQVTPLADASNPGSELATAALLARLGSPTPALEMLAELRARIDSGEVESSEEFNELLESVTTLVARTEHPTSEAVDEEACGRVIDALGPTGQMLVAQATLNTQQLDRLASAGAVLLAVLVCVVVGGALVALAGIAAVVIFLVMAALGKTAGIARESDEWSHVYAEVFAVWMLAYLGLLIIPRSLFEWLKTAGYPTPSMDVGLGIAVLATVLAAAIGLWWGTLRGLRLRRLMQGIGLVKFRFVDIAWGLVCWSMGVALLLVGLLGAFILSGIFSNGKIQAGHPIQQMVEESGGLGLLFTYLLACVSAPLFEEIFFRGALYRNLRQSFGRWGSLGGALVSMVVSSVIFAAIHPQGLIFIPVLGSLAMAFCLMREWRGTINASIVAHAMNNLVVLTMNVLMLRS